MLAEVSLESRLVAAESNKLALAALHDSRVRELEKQHVACWSEMAELSLVIRDNHEWEMLSREKPVICETCGAVACTEFHSFNAWLADAAPHSRSAMYMAMGLREELQDVPTKDLREIPLGSAKVLAKVPKSRRKDRETIKAAKKKPREFVAHIQQTQPDLHIETVAPREFKFTGSQEQVIDGAIELVRLLMGLGSDEECLEALCADFISENQELYAKMKSGEII